MSDAAFPRLNDPLLLVAFDGWNDAAEAASAVVQHLAGEWDAEPLAELDGEDYYDFQMHRPLLTYDEAGTRQLTWPAPVILIARPDLLDRDVLLFRGPEPNLRWRTFCDSLLDLAQEAGVSELVTFGALLADVPHTRPTPVSSTSTDTRYSGRISLPPSTYTGPVGINAVLGAAAEERGVPSVALWAAVPHYLAEPPCPKATLALLGALEDVVGTGLPQGELSALAAAWQRGADEIVAEDEDISSYVRELESERDTTELPEASGDAIAREFQRYLRRRDDG